MKRTLMIGVLLLSAHASADWYFRGTSNSWGTTAMDYVGGTEYQTCQSFASGDASGGPRFKIDRSGDWQEAYPVSDYGVGSDKSYQISFFSDSHSILVAEVASCGGAGGSATNFSSLYFRGTSNAWGASAMQLVADNTWQLTINFDGQADQRFKVDVYGDWSQNYGDNNSDGVLDQFGSDIYTGVTGDYLLTVDDATLGYTLEPVGGCTQNCGSSVQTLGAVYSPTETTFSLWSPDHSSVQLVLDGQSYAMSKIPDASLVGTGMTDVYSVTVSGDWKLKSYYFVVNGIVVRDPYGKMVEPNTDNNIVMDLSTTDLPGGWSPVPALNQREDAVIYELHVRDFTIASESGVSAAKRGKFLGLVEGGTSYNGVSTGIDHLKELGVTHVQLMPVYDFASCANLADTSCYNWGYDPRNYNVPEERYSLTPYDYENRVREFKQMVDEFHRAGIRVIMDVVYNHTYAKSTFEPISASYYTATDLSGTGNSIDANVPMVSRMIRDSLEYWVDEYNIDGFRFDLIGIFDYDEVQDWADNLNSRFPDRNLLIYGEPWNGYAADPRELERVRLGTIGRIYQSHVGVFNPKFREAIKGQNDSGGCNSGDCFAFNDNPDTWRIEVGSRGGIRYAKDASGVIDTWDPMFAMDPEQSINYVSAHDNLTLRDKILEWADQNGISHSDPYLRRIQKFANGIVLTSQGIPFLHGGVELMRDKQGDHNSYQSPDAINQYNWQWKVDNADVLAYYEDVIALRKAHPALRLTSWDAVDQHMAASRPRYGVVIHRIDGAAVGDSWSDILVIYNSADNYSYSLPAGDWKVAMEKSDPAAGNGRSVNGSVVAEGTAVTVLYRQ
ncbi:type I pullulanase [Microbulbifer hainanensis]|uniref:type I pullulanase n=1 Tax=Microbulbifer hainanensis TaxID=2735675 RepID=UPI00186859E7|nr:type I pullulanase [Microbulbifer hainanensis]